MSENREYVSRDLENGTINVSEEVLASMAAMTIMDVEGVRGLSSAISMKKSATRGIRVVISDDDTVSVNCYIIVLYGYSVIEVAKAVQEAVSANLEATVGKKVSAVNVSVSGICHPKSVKK